jgi:hypothetical protein
MRFQPPGRGCSPSGIGRPAEQEPQRSELDVGKSGCVAGEKRKAKVSGVPFDGHFDVIDHVTHIDDSV